jgi:hypothetical protein
MRVSLILLSLVVLTACTAVPQKRAEQSVPPPTTTSSAVTLPPRPKEVLLDAVDPCAVLSADKLKELGLDSAPTPYVEPSFGGARACTIRGMRGGNVARLALVTVSGVDVWLSDNAQVDTKLSAIEGFAAITVRTPGMEQFCNVEIDVAAGQFLDVMFRDGGNEPPTQQDHLCLGAQRVAEAAMDGLLHTR